MTCLSCHPCRPRPLPETRAAATSVLGVEHVLLIREPVTATGQQFGRLTLVQLETTRVSRVEVLQAEAFTLGDTEWINVFLDAVKNFSSCMARLPFAI